MLAIILPLLSYFFVYLIAKTSNCKANCKNRTCGQSDGCSGKCKECPNGGTCDGKKCNEIAAAPSKELPGNAKKGYLPSSSAPLVAWPALDLCLDLV